MQNYKIEFVSWQNKEEALTSLRHRVFILEQNIPAELEWDGEDPHCRHILASGLDNTPLGCARFKTDGKIERMCVLRPYRHHGIGLAILKKILHVAKIEKMTHVYLNAQESAMGFYHRIGFEDDGPPFLEADIIHQKMYLKLENYHEKPSD